MAPIPDARNIALEWCGFKPKSGLMDRYNRPLVVFSCSAPVKSAGCAQEAPDGNIWPPPVSPHDLPENAPFGGRVNAL